MEHAYNPSLSSKHLNNYKGHPIVLWKTRWLVVSALDSESRGPDSSPGQVIVLCSWVRHFTLTVPLSTQEYKWVPANWQGNLMKCWWVTCDGLATHPGGVTILPGLQITNGQVPVTLSGQTCFCSDTSILARFWPVKLKQS